MSSEHPGATAKGRAPNPPSPVDEPEPWTQGEGQWIKMAVWVSAVAVVLGGVAICALFGGFSGPLAVAGDVVVTQAWTAEGNACVGTGPFADVRGGTRVVIEEFRNDKTVADARLSEGRVDAGVCRFSWTAEVPEGYDVYLVSVGSQSSIAVSEDDMESGLELRLTQ